jgi:hypothetical protein
VKDWMPLWIGPWLLKWAALLSIPALLVALFGFPHMLWSYQHARGSRVNLVCHYLGPFGVIRMEPGRGVPDSCPVFWTIKREFLQ